MRTPLNKRILFFFIDICNAREFCILHYGKLNDMED